MHVLYMLKRLINAKSIKLSYLMFIECVFVAYKKSVLRYPGYYIWMFFIGHVIRKSQKQIVQ